MWKFDRALRKHRHVLTLGLLAGLSVGLSACAGHTVDAPVAPAPDSQWWSPGKGTTFPELSRYFNPGGRLEVLLNGGAMPTAGHPFFEPGSDGNGRACVSCHQPADAMSVSTATLKARWTASAGTDPVFAATDGANCPNSTPGQRDSHSLLLDRGLFRIAMVWPPRDPAGNRIEPEFDLEVVRDPTGCNLDPTWGLASANPAVSVYRRPRVVANLRYITRPGASINLKNGRAMAVDPDTGIPVTMNLMADARHPTLKVQALDALKVHHQRTTQAGDEELAQILDFLSRIHLAQGIDAKAGDLTANGTSTAIGARAMATGPVGILGDNLTRPVFGDVAQWGDEERLASIKRGHEIFMMRPFFIRDVTYLNSIGLGNPVKRTCSTCHNNTMTGMDLAPGWMDIGVANQPWADPAPELPLFRLTCRSDANPHPYLGRTVLTTDPGRALVTGRCVDIGAINIQQMRGMAARAPYFSNGAAQTLEDVVRFYDRRFDMKLSEAEVQDLANFLRTL